MTTKEFVAIEKALLHGLPGFTIKGSLLFVSPIKHLLRGVSFDGSSFSKTKFHVTYFVMPLCVPSKHLTLSFGNRLRLRGIDGWDSQLPNLIAELGSALKEQALPLFKPMQSLADFIAYARLSPGTNPQTLRSIAYALARSGQSDQAVAAINEMQKHNDLQFAWQKEISEESQALREKLIEAPDAANKQLEEWEACTIHSLGLDVYQQV
jgi:hypothetical protein